MRYRVFALSVATLALLVLSAVVAQDRDDRPDPVRPRAGKSPSFEGKIVRVNAEARTLVLRDARPGPGTPAPGGGAGVGRTMNFLLARGAVITLDGKKVDLKDMKEGYKVRVVLDTVNPGPKDAPGPTPPGVGAPGMAMLAGRLEARSRDTEGPPGK